MEKTVLGLPYGEQLSRAHVDDLQSSPYLENFQGTTYSPGPWSLTLLQFTIPSPGSLGFLEVTENIETVFVNSPEALSNGE